MLEELAIKYMDEPLGCIPKEGLHETMDLYAKQQAIGFAEWIIKNSYQGVDTSDEGIIWNIAGSATCLTSTELYSLYLTQQK